MPTLTETRPQLVPGDALDVLLSRASVGQLRDPAPEGRALDLILEAALRAPDHGRLRPWRFVLIRGAARAAFADEVETALRRRQPDVAPALVDRQRARFTNTPLVIALGAHIRPDHQIPEIEQMLAVGAGAMNALNAVHALGFGAVWVTGPNSYDPALSAVLGLPLPHRLAGFLFVGTPAGDAPSPPRPDLGNHVVDWVRPG